MDPNDPPLGLELARRMREHESRLLVDALRGTRLTLLYANAGASRSALLFEGVVPLLARREADLPQAGSGDTRGVAPFIDRRDPRGGADAGAAHHELVVYFSDWGLDPLPALLAEIRAAVPREPIGNRPDDSLADVLEAICDRLDARCLVILDAFEPFWTDRADTAEADRFVAALGEAVGRPLLRANFLLAVDERLENRLQPMREAIPGFDDSAVRLLGFERDGEPAPPPPKRRPPPAPPAEPPVQLSVPEPERPPAPAPLLPVLTDAVVPIAAPAPPQKPPRPKRPPKVPLPPKPPIEVDGVYALIASTLQQTADASAPWQGDGVPRQPAPPPLPLPHPSGAADSGFEATRPEYPPEVEYPGLRGMPMPLLPARPVRRGGAIAWIRRFFGRG